MNRAPALPGPRVDLREVTLPELLRVQVEDDPDRTFVSFIGGRTLTFGELAERALRLADGFRHLGVSRFDRVAMFLGNRAEFIETWFALSLVGAVEVPLNIELRGPLLDHVLRDCAAEVLVIEAEHLEMVATSAAFASFRHVVVVGERSGGPVGSAEVREFEDLLGPEAGWGTADEVHHADPIAILYTSGSTGVSKGVVSSHLQYYLWAANLADNMGLSARDSYYHCLPLFYGDAQFFATYFALIHGTTVTFSPRFSASRYWEDVARSKATATNLLGAMTHILWKQAPTERDAVNPLRICNAIPMPTFKEGFERRFGIDLVTGYGQTETNLVVYDKVGDSREGSCGRAGPGYQVAIVDENDRTLPPGEVGEIIVRSERPFGILTEYHRRPEATEAAVRNRWFHTGDAGYLDEDGWLYFVDRIKDVIRRRGQNISALEVEQVLLQHPVVLDAAAVAVPSDMSEDEVKVVVSVDRGSSLSPDELAIFCRDRMARFMVPRYIEIRHEPLPTTASEKIAKSVLKQEGVGPDTWDREDPARRGVPDREPHPAAKDGETDG